MDALPDGPLHIHPDAHDDVGAERPLDQTAGADSGRITPRGLGFHPAVKITRSTRCFVLFVCMADQGEECEEL
jgi:hypothetical protein